MAFIVVSGTPGVGKSTVSSRLAERIGFDLLDLNRWLLSEGFVLGFDELRRVHVVDLESARIRFSRFKPADRTIVEGHLAHLVVPVDSISLAFVVRCHPIVLAGRLVSLGYTARKVLENVEAELLGVCVEEAIDMYGSKLVYEVDNSYRCIDSTVDEMVSILSDRSKRSERIDWFSRLLDEGILDRVLLAIESKSLEFLDGILKHASDRNV
ncbi:MAG: adenylate kinase family protein [Nitrososphaerota archaeon]|nr:adenylate kinase family protein [Candidatus Bathyarchaeota archaeon]MCX8162691.1 adenylate kinase family protein [Candidatus Bathyarchaeota archaeon]MDW8062512.1 adenylate kinase family protein [Nitrososphaerota archaeon]